MARRYNELFIGADKLNIEGRSIKHPSLFKVYATLNVNKTSEEPIKLIGLDLETNHITAELKLLGFFNGKRYDYYYKDEWVQCLFNVVRYADHNESAIAYWNRLDPFVLFKQFLYHVTDKERERALNNFGKISGEWDRVEEVWTDEPIVKVKIGQFYFGIKNVIRSSVQFFFQRENQKPRTVWAYDIAQMFSGGLEKEAKKYKLEYYSKVDESAHLVDWERFENDPSYKAMVLHSNENDARAVYDLGMTLQAQFKEVFHHYPRNLISQGALARSAIVAVTMNRHGLENIDDMEVDVQAQLMEKVSEDLRAIPLINYQDKWVNEYGQEVVKDLLALVMESYSGGQIEAYQYGYIKEAVTSDKVQAYPSTTIDLEDLRGAKITWGNGEPPTIPHSYCFIRGDVNIPRTLDYHPLTVKHPLFKSTNIRPVGEFKASYTKIERDFMAKHGATFTNETWYNIETKGELSPLAYATQTLIDMRELYRPEGKDHLPKTTSASVYGLTVEAIDTYIESVEGIARDGYRVGEFFNSIFASWITSSTRVHLSEACHEVVKNGGEPILAMTDAFYFKGEPWMLSQDFWKEKKTVRYFEKPYVVKDLVCYGAGRYSYKKYNTETGNYDKVVSKNRGLSSAEMLDSDGMEVDGFNWLDASEIVKKQNTTEIEITTRRLISVGMVNNNNIITQYDHENKKIIETPISWVDLGKVVDVYTKIDVIAGKTKRLYDEDITNASLITSQLVKTRPVLLARGMDGTDTINDQTLPDLRAMMMSKELKTAKDKRRKNVANASKRYYDSKKEKVKAHRNTNYDYLRSLGYNSYEATKMMGWSTLKLAQKLKEDNKV